MLNRSETLILPFRIGKIYMKSSNKKNKAKKIQYSNKSFTTHFTTTITTTTTTQKPKHVSKTPLERFGLDGFLDAEHIMKILSRNKINYRF